RIARQPATPRLTTRTLALPALTRAGVPACRTWQTKSKIGSDASPGGDPRPGRSCPPRGCRRPRRATPRLQQLESGGAGSVGTRNPTKGGPKAIQPLSAAHCCVVQRLSASKKATVSRNNDTPPFIAPVVRSDEAKRSERAASVADMHMLAEAVQAAAACR